MIAFNTSTDRAELGIVNVNIMGGTTSAEIVPTGVVGDVPSGEFSFQISELDAITRQVSVSWIFQQAILAPGTTFLGQPFGQLAFEFGTPTAVLDPLLTVPAAVVEIISSNGTLTDQDGNSFNVGGFLFLGAGNGGLVGVNAFVLPDEFGNQLDISTAGWNGFSGSAVYRVVPEPASTVFLALFGLAAARRRR